jgi:CheY-like chemotaxis protein
MDNLELHLLLADDDTDDCNFFKEALDELHAVAKLVIVNDGVGLMEYLTENLNSLPHALYLDINMPRKNGFDCLAEIKSNENLKQLPVIIFSTSFDTETANKLYLNGAQHFIKKPAEFLNFKKVISKSLNFISSNTTTGTEKFVLTP